MQKIRSTICNALGKSNNFEVVTKERNVPLAYPISLDTIQHKIFPLVNDARTKIIIGAMQAEDSPEGLGQGVGITLELEDDQFQDFIKNQFSAYMNYKVHPCINISYSYQDEIDISLTIRPAARAKAATKERSCAIC